MIGYEGTATPFSISIDDTDNSGDYVIRLSDTGSNQSWQWSGEELTVSDDSGVANVALATDAAFAVADNGQYDLIAELLDGGVVVGSEAVTTTIREVPAVLEVAAIDNAIADDGSFGVNISYSDPGDDPLAHWLVSWGDGTTDTFASNISAATHNYGGQLGHFEVKVTATNTDGETVTAGLALDRSFGVDGKVSTDLFTDTDIAEAVIVQPDGKIIVAGSTKTTDLDLPGGLDFTFGNGSSSASASGKQQIRSDQFYEVHEGRSYRLSVDVWSGDGNGGEVNGDALHLIGFDTYDIDQNSIRAHHVLKVDAATDTRLAVALNPGDTTITLDDAAGWYDGTAGHQRSFAWYGYANSLGETYDDYTYTRNALLDLWDADAINGNVITLRDPWAGESVAAGTAVRNARSNGTYQYALLANQSVSESPLALSTIIGGDRESASYQGFRTGVAYIKPLVLANWNDETGNRLNVDNFTITPVAEYEAHNAALVRYNADGSIDQSFGHAGIVSADFTVDGIASDLFDDVKLQADGKILAIGRYSVSGQSNNFLLARFNADGSLDTSFGSGTGFVSTDIDAGSNDLGLSVNFQGDKIVVAGRAYKSSTNKWDFAVARYHADGSLDTSFGGDGIIVAEVAGFDYLHDVGIQSSGILLVGRQYVAGEGNWNMSVLKYDNSGNIDTSFGTRGDGYVFFNAFENRADAARQILVNDDDSFYLAGYGVPSSTLNDFLVVAYDADGNLNTGFGANGVARIDLGGNDVGTSATMMADGRIVVGGYRQFGNTNDGFRRTFAAARLHADGTPDVSFGHNGTALVNFPGKNDFASSVALTADGGFVLAGYHQSEDHGSDFALTKFLPRNSVELTLDEGLVVSTLVDENDGDYSHGDLSLREALALADQIDGANTITFASSLFDTVGSQTIQLTSTLVVDSEVSIVGPDADLLTIDITTLQFRVSSNLSGMTITGGSGSKLWFSQVSELHQVVIDNEIVTSATTGLIASNTKFFNKQLNLWGGSNEIQESLFDGSRVYLSFANANISNTTFTGYVGDSAPLYVDYGSARLQNVTISGNESTGVSGGLHLGSYGSATLVNTTITDNRADSIGTGGPRAGGVYLAGEDYGGGYTEPASLTLYNSIVAGNRVGSGTEFIDIAWKGEAESVTGQNNLIGVDDTGSMLDGSNGNIVGATDPQLAPLADNGGPTLSHRPLTGSDAIDAGDSALAVDANGNSLTSDQRGFERLAGTVDIGAVETGLVVSSSADIVDGNYSVGQLSLREALQLAQQTDGADTITFASGINVIGLDTELATDFDFTLQGPGSGELTIFRGSPGKIFDIQGGANISISGMTLSANGGIKFTEQQGGVIRHAAGNLLLSNVRVNGGRAEYGGGIWSGSDGTLTLDGSVVADNFSTDAGGGIFKSGGTLELVQSTIHRNSSNWSAGGVYVADSTQLTVNGSTIARNYVDGYTAGLYLGDGDANIYNSTISGNISTEGAGGVFVDGGDATFTNVTVTDNQSWYWYAGGIQSTSDATTVLRNTIVAGNRDFGQSAYDLVGVDAASSANNLIGVDATNVFVDGVNQNHVIGSNSPELGELKINGGIVATHHLLFNSLAIDSGNYLFIEQATGASIDTLNDQRDEAFARWRGDAVDIGAFERYQESENGVLAAANNSSTAGDSDDGAVVAFAAASANEMGDDGSVPPCGEDGSDSMCCPGGGDGEEAEIDVIDEGGQECCCEDGGTDDGSGTDGSGTDGSGEDGSGEDGSGEDGSGEDGSGEDGSGEDGSGESGGSDSGSDGGSDDGTDGGSDDGSDGGSDDGSDGGSDDGSDGGSDDGSDGGSDSGSDGGSDDGSDGGSDDGSDGGSDDGNDGGSDGGADGGSDGGSGGGNGGGDGGGNGGGDGGGDPDPPYIVVHSAATREGNRIGFKVQLRDPDNLVRLNDSIGVAIGTRSATAKAGSDYSGGNQAIFLSDLFKTKYFWVGTHADSDPTDLAAEVFHVLVGAAKWRYFDGRQDVLVDLEVRYAGGRDYAIGRIWDVPPPPPPEDPEGPNGDGGGDGGSDGGGISPPTAYFGHGWHYGWNGIPGDFYGAADSFEEAHRDWYEQHVDCVANEECDGGYYGLWGGYWGGYGWFGSGPGYANGYGYWGHWGGMVEGQTGDFARHVPVFLSHATDRPVTVTVGAQDITATEGEDFELLTTQVKFKPGETLAWALIDVHDDTLREPHELFRLDLESATGANIDEYRDRFYGTIFDANVNISIDDQNGTEELDPGAVVWRNSDFSKEVPVSNPDPDAPAAFDPDYTGAPDVLDPEYASDFTHGYVSLNHYWWWWDHTSVEPLNDYRVTLDFDDDLIDMWVTGTNWEGLEEVETTNGQGIVYKVRPGQELTPHSRRLDFWIEGIGTSDDFDAKDFIKVEATSARRSVTWEDTGNYGVADFDLSIKLEGEDQPTHGSLEDDPESTVLSTLGWLDSTLSVDLASGLPDGAFLTLHPSDPDILIVETEDDLGDGAADTELIDSDTRITSAESALQVDVVNPGDHTIVLRYHENDEDVDGKVVDAVSFKLRDGANPQNDYYPVDYEEAGETWEFDVLANDHKADELQIVSVSNASHGTINIVDGQDGQKVIYVPTLEANGWDTFTYTVENEFGETFEAEVVVGITRPDLFRRVTLSELDPATQQQLIDDHNDWLFRTAVKNFGQAVATELRDNHPTVARPGTTANGEPFAPPSLEWIARLIGGGWEFKPFEIGLNDGPYTYFDRDVSFTNRTISFAATQKFYSNVDAEPVSAEIQAEAIMSYISDQRVLEHGVGFDGFVDPIKAGLDTFVTNPRVQFVAAASLVALAGPVGWATAGAFTGSMTVGGVTLATSAGVGQAAVAVGSVYAIARAADDTIGQLDTNDTGFADSSVGREFLNYFTEDENLTDDIITSADMAVVVVEMAPGIFKSIRGVATFASEVATGTVKKVQSAGNDFIQLLDEAVHCFAPDTLVATETGRRPISDIQIGENVWSHDPETGESVLGEVEATHHNAYSGPWVSLGVDSDVSIEVTGNHPFWVVEGEDLSERPIPKHDGQPLFEEHGDTTGGRWVFSQHLQPGDLLLTRSGEYVRVASINMQDVENKPVCNLTISGLHNYFVSLAEVLAHNTSPCAAFRQAFPDKPANLIQLAKSKGYTLFPSRVVHAHHIVMKVGKGVLGKRYTNFAQRMLRDAGIEVLDDADSLARAAAAGDTGWDNMTYALNYADGIHSTKYQRAVTKRLWLAKKEAVTDGKDVSVALKAELGKMKQELTNGEAFWN